MKYIREIIQCRKNFACTLIALFAFSACSVVQPVKVSEIKSVKITAASMNGIDLEVGFIISNPNLFSINIDKADVNLTINKILLGKASLTKNVKLAAKSNEQKFFLLHTSLADMPLSKVISLLALIKNREIDLEVNGTSTASAIGISGDYPINAQKKISLR